MNDHPAQIDTWAELILNTIPEAMLVVDEQGQVVQANNGANEIFGYPAGEMLGLGVEALVPERLRTAHTGLRAQFMNMPPSHTITGHGRELQGRRRDGSEFPAEIGLGTMRMGERAFVVVSVVDISERKHAEEKLRIAAIAFESQSGMIVTDPQGIILRVNQSFTRLTGYSAEEALGQTPKMLGSGLHSPAFYRQMWAAITENGYWQGQIWNRRKNGRIYAEWLTIANVIAANGEVTHYVGTFTDITQNNEAAAQIHRLAYYDQLTKLPNRNLLLDRLGQALATASRNRRYGAILILGLDNFKAVNDAHDHDTGDLLLIEVAQRLSLAVREDDTVARLGSDEFVLLLEEISDDQVEAAALAKQIGEKLVAAISQPCLVNGHELYCTASIGIGLFFIQETVEDLLKRADLAMDQAKSAGRNTLCFFDPTMQHRLEEHSALKTELRKALNLKQFQLFYQPQIDVNGHVIGAEALLRWPHPKRGMIAPNTFIPLAEDSGLILPIGLWVLETACAQLSIWSADESTHSLVLAVNISARQFRQADFVDQVMAVLDASGANPVRLKLELTESLVLDNVEDTIEKMKLLKTRGISFSMDDFGTGYSSLAYLTQLPLDQLKIDRSFVLNLPQNVNDGIVARTIITMGSSLGLDVIAEGVETEEQRAFLEGNGCLAYQGYLYSKPLPVEKFGEFIATNKMQSEQEDT